MTRSNERRAPGCRAALSSLVAAVLAVLPAAAQTALGPPAEARPVERADTAPASEAFLLRLRDGRTVWGSILGHDPDVLSFRRLEAGGVVPIPWSLLDPNEERELRVRFGYVDAFAEEITVDAERLVLTDGSEVVGAIVNRDDEHLWLKRASGTIPVAKRLVTNATSVQVPALEVYTKDELYQRRAAELQTQLVLPGREGAAAHLELARHAERLFDFTHAVEHYAIAAALDPTYEADSVRVALERAQEKAANQAQVDLLAEIDLWRARRRYDRALELLQAFPTLYPRSPLMEDWNKLRGRVERYQERDLRDEVVDRWHYWTIQLAREAAREKPGFEEALAYVEGQMGQDVMTRVQADLQRLAPSIEPNEVRRLWSARDGGRYRQASYGLGTWILGEERALAGTPEAEETEPAEPGTQTDARQKLEERVKRYLRNQELARKAKSAGQAQENPAEFWDGWNHSGRAHWLLAYYVENSGDFRDLKTRLANCRECGGTGTREVIYTGGAMTGSKATTRIVACPTCHTIGRLRRVRYR